jgi:hypothetical protein
VAFDAVACPAAPETTGPEVSLPWREKHAGRAFFTGPKHPARSDIGVPHGGV